MGHKRCWDLLAAVLLFPGLAHAQTGTALVNGVFAEAQGSQDSIQTFYLEVPAGMSSLTFGADGTYGEYGDAVVYINFGEPFLTGDDTTPECVLLEDSYAETCEILNPAAGFWYVEVHGLTQFAGYYVGATAATALADGQATLITGTDPWYYIDVPPDQKLLYITTSGGIVIRKVGGLFNEVVCESFETPLGVCKFFVPDGGGRFYVQIVGNQTGTGLLAEYVPAGSIVGGGETGLSHAEQLHVWGAQNSIHTFFLDVPAGVSLLRVDIVGGGGDADFFVNYDEPYLTSADRSPECARLDTPDDFLSDHDCTIFNPAAGRWYVEVYGATEFSDVGLFAIAATALQNGQALTIAGAMDSRAAYYIDVPSGSEQLTVSTSGGTGNPDLRLGNNVECHSANSGTVESCQISSPGGVRWFVLVEGTSEYSDVALVATYTAPPPPPPPPPDDPPDAYTFTDVSGADPQTVVESNVITVTGTNLLQPISVTGGEYRVGNSGYVTSVGTVTSGQTVQVRATAGPFGQTVHAVLTIGGVTNSFDVTSRAANSDSALDSGGNPVLVSTSAGALMNLAQVPTPVLAPTGYQYQHGFFAFDITGLTPGGAATVTMTLPVGAAPSHYVKCTASSCGTFIGASIVGNVVTLTLVDGGTGDSDNLANGTISDPGAPATLTGGGGGYGGGGGAMDRLSLSLGLLLLAFRRKRPPARA